MTNMPMRALRVAAVVIAAMLSASTGAVAQDSDTDGQDTGPPVTIAPPIDDPTDEVIHSWALAPANTDGAGNRPQLTYAADAGTVIDDELTLYNYGNQQLTFRIYSSDAFNNDSGDFDILSNPEESSDAGTWVSIPQEFIQLPPGQQVTFPISIAIPDDAQPGDHAAGIVAASEAQSASEVGARVGVERRTGTRLYVRVNGPLRAELAVEELSTAYSPVANPFGGSATVTYRVQNTGNVRLGGTSGVKVAGPFGIGEQQSPSEEFPELLPGQGFTISREFDDVPAFGFVRTVVDLVPEDVSNASPVTVSATTFAPPIAIVLLLAVLLFAILALRAYRRHRSADKSDIPQRQADSEPQMV